MNPQSPHDSRSAPGLDHAVLAFVLLGQNVRSNWAVQIDEWTTFAAAVAMTASTDTFDPARVNDTFEPLFNDAARVQFGRETSPAIYVDVPYHRRQTGDHRDWRPQHYTASERREYVARVIAWANDMNADEILVEQTVDPPETFDGEPGPNPGVIRIWWE